MRRQKSLLWMIILAVTIAGGTAASQSRIDFNAAKGQSGAQGDVLNQSTPRGIPDRLSEQYLQKRLEYDIESLAHATRVFRWQLFCTQVVFVLVVVIILVGLYLSFMQFRRGETAVTSMKFGSAGVEITSPVIGLLVLALSLGFFYAYLTVALPIEEVGQRTSASAPP